MSNPRINYPDTWPQEAREALDALFSEARAKRLWFFHGGLSGPLWFSPDQLQSQQKRGFFVWGAVNWSLRSPQERLDAIDKEVAARLKERKEVEREMTRCG